MLVQSYERRVNLSEHRIQYHAGTGWRTSPTLPEFPGTRLPLNECGPQTPVKISVNLICYFRISNQRTSSVPPDQGFSRWSFKACMSFISWIHVRMVRFYRKAKLALSHMSSKFPSLSSRTVKCCFTVLRHSSALLTSRSLLAMSSLHCSSSRLLCSNSCVAAQDRDMFMKYWEKGRIEYVPVVVASQLCKALISAKALVDSTIFIKSQSLGVCWPTIRMNTNSHTRTISIHLAVVDDIGEGSMVLAWVMSCSSAVES